MPENSVSDVRVPVCLVMKTVHCTLLSPAADSNQRDRDSNR